MSLTLGDTVRIGSILLLGAGAAKTSFTGFAQVTEKRSVSVAVKQAPFAELDCNGIGDEFVAKVETPDGEVHEFCLDTGWVGNCIISKRLAEKIPHSGERIPCRLLLKDGRKLEFSATPSSNLATLSSKITEGTVGMALLSSFQLKLDFDQKRVWCRTSSKPLSADVAASELSDPLSLVSVPKVASAPLIRSRSGWYTVETRINGRVFNASLDSGASAFFLDPYQVGRNRLPKVANTWIKTPKGVETNGVFMPKSISIAGYPVYWPVVYGSVNVPDTGATLSAAYLPSRQILIDFPGKAVYFRAPSESDLLSIAVRQYFNGTVVLDNGALRMNLPQKSSESPGLEVAPVKNVEDTPASAWITMMKAWAHGDSTVLPQLLYLFEEVMKNGRFTVVLDGKDEEIQVMHGVD